MLTWRRLIGALRLIMAIPEKRHLQCGAILARAHDMLFDSPVLHPDQPHPVLFDTSPFYTEEEHVSAGIGGGRRERRVTAAVQRLTHTLLGALIAWHTALGGRVVLMRRRVVLMRHMLTC